MKLLIPLLLSLVSCTATGFVATASIEGTGATWTDGTTLVAVGEIEGDFTIFGKDTGIEIIFPVRVHEGEILVVNRLSGEELYLPWGTPLPTYCKALFRPGEAEALGLTFEEPVE